MEPASNSSDSYPSIEQDNRTKREQNFESFYFLRAIFALAVIAYKTKIFYIPKMLVPNGFTSALSDYVLSGMFGALAVPVFLQISLFLFYCKSEKTGLSYFLRKRLPRLISLYLFWVCSVTLFDILFVGGMVEIRKATSSLKTFLEFIVGGNSTPYFFFFSLILLTVIGEGLILLFAKLKKPSTKINISYGLFLASSIMVFIFSTIQPILNYTGIQSSLLTFLNNIAGWDYTPVNFFPYAFTAAITMQEYKEGKLEKVTKSLKRKLYGLLVLTLMFFALEWTLTSNRLLIQVDQAPLDHYLRLSLVFGSWLLLYLALLSKRKVPASIKFLSDCSLGIYGFHVFLTFRRPNGSGPFSNIPVVSEFVQDFPVLESLAAFSGTLFGSIVLTLLFKRIKFLRQFV